ncbi:hypothetical protein BASA83_000787 [Batrachochytrium salamandrivorans]|nr:hypothetical protein BASA81_011428 [Batrachochytrium salamandrivorans]KAH9276655.1 hypothetical protein BASA83_000787 [Batrachochytrium salamandrivorans]
MHTADECLFKHSSSATLLSEVPCVPSSFTAAPTSASTTMDGSTSSASTLPCCGTRRSSQSSQSSSHNDVDPCTPSSPSQSLSSSSDVICIFMRSQRGAFSGISVQTDDRSLSAEAVSEYSDDGSSQCSPLRTPTAIIAPSPDALWSSASNRVFDAMRNPPFTGSAFHPSTASHTDRPDQINMFYTMTDRAADKAATSHCGGNASEVNMSNVAGRAVVGLHTRQHAIGGGRRRLELGADPIDDYEVPVAYDAENSLLHGCHVSSLCSPHFKPVLQFKRVD